MQNGDILACCNTTQMVAVPQPSNDSMYYRDSSYIELYDFDNCTGIFFNPITIPYPQPYGLCFSSDNSKLYALPADAIFFSPGMANQFVQFDLSNYNQSAIISSKTILQ
ncbi:MAG: hypothetical protein KKA07_07685, partial [Bacteroidetes bacterium]|nr:hypothetical protein [Bacteroidota bacterium]